MGFIFLAIYYLSMNKNTYAMSKIFWRREFYFLFFYFFESLTDNLGALNLFLTSKKKWSEFINTKQSDLRFIDNNIKV